MEQITDLMWWTIGVIVIGALLIRRGSVLAKVKMLADKDNVKGVETADGYIVAKIRDEDKTKNKSTIYIFLTKNADGTLTIDHAKEVEGDGLALADSTGELYIPDKVNGLDITVIKTAPFETSNFSKLKLPKNLKTIEPKAFVTSYFKGDLVLPESIEVIGELAFYSAKFSGKLILPPKLKEISESTFFNSKFTGELSLPENIKSIGSYAFQHSTFTGELNLPENIEYIGKGAFEKSTFTGTFKSISNSYWDTVTTGKDTSSGGGEGKSTEDMKNADTYSAWDTGVWNIVNGEYPTLK